MIARQHPAQDVDLVLAADLTADVAHPQAQRRSAVSPYCLSLSAPTLRRGFAQAPTRAADEAPGELLVQFLSQNCRWKSVSGRIDHLTGTSTRSIRWSAERRLSTNASVA
ncbi:hypothetical protein [Roseovarius sp. D0-M9]|uniref:hypothetical protein n=1 Tax=Roseovarius sp. D0-M9 TaxID=3127117 RepID=UPI00300FE550